MDDTKNNSTDGIAITPKMIEAGEEAILEEVGGADLGGLFSAAGLARKVLLAMMNQARIMENDLRSALRDFDYSAIPEERRPEPGKHWICTACGKRAADRYGMVGPKSSRWDESCMLNSTQIEHSR